MGTFQIQPQASGPFGSVPSHEALSSFYSIPRSQSYETVVPGNWEQQVLLGERMVWNLVPA